MAKIGYIRVSTEQQNLDRQEDTIKPITDRLFKDKASGKDTNRPEFKKMMDYVREGDTLYVDSISRLARSTKDLLQIVDELRAKEVGLVSLKESIDTETPQGRFILQIFGALSELERESIRQRQREGIDAARRRGKKFGRPRLKNGLTIYRSGFDLPYSRHSSRLRLSCLLTRPMYTKRRCKK